MSTTETTTEARILCHEEPPIGWLIIDNAKRHNAVNLSMWQAMPAAVAALDQNSDIRVIIVCGAGEKTFVSGADISEFETVRRDADSARAYEDANALAFSALRRAMKPTVSMIRGFCFGGGLGIAVATDMRIAADDSVFSIPAAKLGIGYPPEAIRDVVKLTGPSRAKDLYFTARRIDHHEARAIGLIDTVVAAADLEAETRALAATIAANAPLTQRAAKAAIDAVSGDPDAPGWDRIGELTNACFDSADFAEGRRAFLEKRPPVFRGE